MKVLPMRHGDAIEKCGVPVEQLVNALAAGLFARFFPLYGD
jgi:hypothetical protein